MSATYNAKIIRDNTGAIEIPCPANCEVYAAHEKLAVILSAILVLSIQLVFRATVLARLWNY
jgi:hypothetical protein